MSKKTKKMLERHCVKQVVAILITFLTALASIFGLAPGHLQPDFYRDAP